MRRNCCNKSIKKGAPFFSIIVPVYNAERYIEETIRSVTLQTCDDWELVLVDDGSLDNSGILCEKAAEVDSRIRVIHTPNKGGVEARYEGVRQSKGKYLIVIDADDILIDCCLEKVKSTINKVDTDMIIWGFRTFGNENREYHFALPPDQEYSQKEIMYTCLITTSHSLWMRAVSANIMKESCICPLGKLSINTDYAMLIPIISRIRNAYVIDDVLYEYRVYAGSVSHTISMDKIVDTDKVTMYATLELGKTNVYDSTIERAIYASYLKMISSRLLYMMQTGKMNRSQCRIVHELPAYRNSQKYESLKLLGLKKLLLMKCFRHSFYLPFHVLNTIRKKPKRFS